MPVPAPPAAASGGVGRPGGYCAAPVPTSLAARAGAGGYSARVVETGGSGASAFVKITKTRDYFDSRAKELTVFQTDLATLRSLLPVVADGDGEGDDDVVVLGGGGASSGSGGNSGDNNAKGRKRPLAGTTNEEGGVSGGGEGGGKKGREERIPGPRQGQGVVIDLTDL